MISDRIIAIVIVVFVVVVVIVVIVVVVAVAVVVAATFIVVNKVPWLHGFFFLAIKQVSPPGDDDTFLESKMHHNKTKTTRIFIILFLYTVYILLKALYKYTHTMFLCFFNFLIQ